MSRVSDQTFYRNGVVSFSNLTVDVSLRDDDTNWSVSRKKKTKRILDDVSGDLFPGDFVALMGSTGAGKSTLLNVLSGRNTKNGGEVMYYGKPIRVSGVLNSSAVSCFVQQEDMFYGYLTVLEHLRLQSRLRLPLPEHDCFKRVDSVLDLFDLFKAENSYIGNVAQSNKRGISGGEKKRLSLATELLTNSPLVFADEPTSGLDAFMAETVVEFLERLSRQGHTVVATIHQPSYDVFNRFNKILLLSEGRMIYFGRRDNVLPYFSRLGHVPPPFTNPADFLIELLAINWDQPEDSLALLDFLTNNWREDGQYWLRERESTCPPNYPLPDAGSNDTSEGVEGFTMPIDLITGLPKVVNWITSIQTVTKRMILETNRNLGLAGMRLAHSIFIAFLTGFLSLRLGVDDWYSKAGALYFVVLQLGFQSVTNVAMAFCIDRPLIARDRESGLVSSPIVLISRVISDLPMQIILPLAFTTISWWMIGFRDNFVHYLWAVSFTVSIALGATSIGYITAAVTSVQSLAVGLAPVILVPMLMISPFVIHPDSLHPAWSWLYYASPFTHGWKGLMYVTFHDVEFSPGCVPSPGALCSGNKVLEYYHIYHTDIWMYYVLLYIIAIVGRLLACYLLHISSTRKENE